MLRIAAVLIAIFALQAPGPAPSTAAIQGEVLDAKTQAPIRDAMVTLTPPGGMSMTFETDREGKFVAGDLPAGRYQATATKNGYAKGVLKGRFQLLPVVSVVLKEGAATALQMRLMPGGVVTGRIVDLRGKPLSGVQVYALSDNYSSSQRRLVRSGETAASDDRGEFRLFGLEPRKYYLAADAYRDRYNLAPTHIPANADETYVTTFFPGTADFSQAVVLDVQPGETRLNDMRMLSLRTPVIRGVVVLKTPVQPFPFLTVTMQAIPPVAKPQTFQIRSSVSGSPERFEVLGATPGKYELNVRARRDATNLTGRTVIEVGDSDLDTQVVVAPLLSLKGRVVLDPASPQPPALTNMRASLVPDNRSSLVAMPAGSASALLRPDGTFTIEGLVATRYRVRLAGESDGYLSAALAGTAEILANGLDLENALPDLTLTWTAGTGRISGTVTDTAKKPQPAATVLLIPEPVLRLRPELYRTVSSDPNGHFDTLRVTPGKYMLLAFDEVDLATCFDPEFLKAYQSRAVSLDVKGGQPVELDLVVIPAP